MEIKKLYGYEIEFSEKMGYPINDLYHICEMEKILYDDLHVGPTVEEITPYAFWRMFRENEMYAKSFNYVAHELEILAKKNNMLAKSRLASMYLRFDRRYYGLGLQYAGEAAEAGAALGQYLYGLYGKFYTESMKRFWMKQAMDAGLPAARSTLGDWYLNGTDWMPKNKEMGLDILFNDGDTKAAYIAYSYYYDKKVLDDDQYLEKLKYCLSFPYPYYMIKHMLGIIYMFKGQYTNAYNMLKDAAESGIVRSYEKLAELYNKGFNGPESAAYWRREAEIINHYKTEYENL